MCKTSKLTHLIFADDLIIYCKGNMGSISRVMDALTYFSSAFGYVMDALTHFRNAFGLVENEEKSNNFLGIVNDEIKQEIFDRKCFSLGTLRMLYLGLPLSSKKLSKIKCPQLVERSPQGSQHILDNYLMLVDFKP